jgi:hypothetical protein
VSLYNSCSHKLLYCSHGVCKKRDVGNAGCAFTREILSQILRSVPDNRCEPLAPPHLAWPGLAWPQARTWLLTRLLAVCHRNFDWNFSRYMFLDKKKMLYALSPSMVEVCMVPRQSARQ